MHKTSTDRNNDEASFFNARRATTTKGNCGSKDDLPNVVSLTQSQQYVPPNSLTLRAPFKKLGCPPFCSPDLSSPTPSPRSTFSPHHTITFNHAPCLACPLRTSFHSSTQATTYSSLNTFAPSLHTPLTLSHDKNYASFFLSLRSRPTWSPSHSTLPRSFNAPALLTPSNPLSSLDLPRRPSSSAFPAPSPLVRINF